MNGVSEYDQLLYSIGNAAQTHVSIERALRQVYTTIIAPGLGVYLATSIRGIDRLVDHIAVMLDNADVPKNIKSAGIAVLSAAKDADELRNRLVHDWWINRVKPGEEKPVLEQHQVIKGLLHGFKVTARDLTYVRSGIRKLVRTYHRIYALNHVLSDELPFYKSSGVKSLIPVSFWLKIMEDNFKVNKDGSIQALNS